MHPSASSHTTAGKPDDGCVLPPPGESKHKDVRYIHEDDQIDEAQLAAWVKQASLLPGERM
jgi:hypothetical protein